MPNLHPLTPAEAPRWWAAMLHLGKAGRVQPHANGGTAMVATLRNVLAVAEELENHGWPVLNLDIVQGDMPRIEIAAGNDLEPDDGPAPIRYRTRASATGFLQWNAMEYRGVRITWHCDAPAPAEPGFALTDEEDAALDHWLDSRQLAMEDSHA